MRLTPSENLTDAQIQSGLKSIVKDGLASEAMTTLTGGAFLVALALSYGASNFQIGLLAALPTIASVFQLFAVYLVQKYENRRAITVYSSLFARLPLLIIAFLPFLFPSSLNLTLLIAFLFIHYFLASISLCSWNSWMKDLVPEKMLGSYFASRSRLVQILSVTLCIICAIVLDYIKNNYPSYEITTYSVMFFIGGIFGIIGVFLLAQTPEPRFRAVKTNVLKLFKKPLMNHNFRNLLVFNSIWAFAVNLAAPFFSVYMLQTLELKISYVVGFNILSQFTNILFIRIWGRYSDKYSNKTILRICAPIYLIVILAWTFTTMPKPHLLTIPLLAVIFILNGIAVAGINLSLSNIGLKLAPKEGDAIVYLTAKSMITAVFAAVAPVIGGLFADFFAKRELSWNLEWKSPDGNMLFHTLDLQQWDFFFVLAFIFGLIALYRLSFVKEDGESHAKIPVYDIVSELRREVKMNSTVAGLRAMIYMPASFIQVVKRKAKSFPIKKENEVFKDEVLNSTH